jgi:hypothetical protein
LIPNSNGRTIWEICHDFLPNATMLIIYMLHNLAWMHNAVNQWSDQSFSNEYFDAAKVTITYRKM